MRINRSGFTIVELLTVIVVIAILAGITIIAYNGIQARSRDDRRRTDVANIEKAMELYYSDNGTYPKPTGATGSIINPSWYTSGDSSWNMLSGLLVGSQAIDAVPVDPRNISNISPLAAGGYSYAVFVNTGSYCGSSSGQMYLIIYRLEGSAQEKSSEGPCTNNPLGDNYYNSNGVSYYRNVKSGS